MSFDVLLVGGGLASGLTVLALRHRHPDLRIGLVEAGRAIGGNHTWSFHATDLDPDAAALVAPLVSHRWSQVAVAFPGQARTLATAYATMTSAHFAAAVTEAMAHAGSQLWLDTRVEHLASEGVELAGGQQLRASLVIDGRGPRVRGTPAGYQKFLGLELELAADSPPWPALETAVVMDARVPQTDGYRFVYVLPFAPRHLLVEDTYYADRPELDRERLRANVFAYVSERGLRVGRVLREEVGVLPLPATRPTGGGPLRIGYRGGWFHPTTGYSLPWAARVANTIAAAAHPDEVAPALSRLANAHRKQARFCERLNALLFRAIPGPLRREVFQRFYRLPRDTIEHFYALATTPWDRARVLCGRPPRGLSWKAAFSSAEAA